MLLIILLMPRVVVGLVVRLAKFCIIYSNIWWMLIPSLADDTNYGILLSTSCCALIVLLEAYKFYELKSASHLLPTMTL